MMTEEVYTQALALAGELEEQEQNLLKLLCGAAVTTLESRIREDIDPESCRDAFVTAACLYALAGLTDAGSGTGIAEFKAGDLTVRKGESLTGGSDRLRQQADELVRPWLRDSFTFLGV